MVLLGETFKEKLAVKNSVRLRYGEIANGLVYSL